MAVYQLPKHLHPDFSRPGKKPVGPVEVVKQFLGVSGFVEDFNGSAKQLAVVPSYNTNTTFSYDYRHGKYAEIDGTADYITYETPPTSTEATFFCIIRPSSSVDGFPCSCRTTFNNQGFEILAGRSGVAGDIRSRTQGSSGIVESPTISMSSKDNWAVMVGRFNSSAVDLFILEEDGTYKTATTSSSPGSITPSQEWKVNRRGSTSKDIGDLALHGYIMRSLSDSEVEAFVYDVYRHLFKPAIPQYYFVPDAAAVTAAITGTSTASITESDVVTGGKTIIITLTGDTWVASGATFDAQRQNIIDGLDSAQSELAGWNAEVRDKESVTAVVRTSDTVVTITLSASASYDITAQETITVTVPASALVTSASAITGSPTFTVDQVAAGGYPIINTYYRTLLSNRGI